MHCELLEFDSRTGFGEFLLDLLSIVLGDLLFDLRRNTFDQFLGIDQGQAGQVLDYLNDVKFLIAEGGKNDIEFGLLNHSGSTAATVGWSSHDNSATSGSFDAMDIL